MLKEANLKCVWEIIHSKKQIVVMFQNKRKQNEKVVDFFTKLGYNIKQHKSDTVAYYE